MNIVKTLKRIYFNILKIDDDENNLFYVCGSDDLPAPLSEEEEKIAIEKMENRRWRGKKIISWT